MYFRHSPRFFILVSVLISLLAGSINYQTASAGTSEALQFNIHHQGTGGASIDFGGADSYVDFGNPSKLHLATYTLECWFRQDGSGKSISTGSGGMTRVIPLVVRGRDDGETANTDINFFLGIDTTQNVLAFDFEEGVGGSKPSLNHPLFGITPITNGVWYHAAATYDGTSMRLYLNGTLDNEIAVSQPVDASSNAYASIGSALNSTGLPSGFFNGVIDEVRIWNRALSQAEIRTNLTQKISSGLNLVSRWGLDEGSGTTISDSAVGTVPANGIVKGTSYSWSGQRANEHEFSSRSSSATNSGEWCNRGFYYAHLERPSQRPGKRRTDYNILRSAKDTHLWPKVHLCCSPRYSDLHNQIKQRSYFLCSDPVDRR